MSKGNQFAALGAIREGKTEEVAAPAKAPEPVKNLQFRTPMSVFQELHMIVFQLGGGITQEEYLTGLTRLANSDPQIQQRAFAEARLYRQEKQRR